MNISKVFSAELDGIEAKLIEVETDINVGLHSFNIVGLADKALSEAKERVNSALKNIGVKAPNKENRRIVVNLAPADVKKTGSHYDLAIALGYLLASKQIKEFDGNDKIFVGELSLDGRLRSINGALNIAKLVKKSGFKFAKEIYNIGRDWKEDFKHFFSPLIINKLAPDYFDTALEFYIQAYQDLNGLNKGFCFESIADNLKETDNKINPNKIPQGKFREGLQKLLL